MPSFTLTPLEEDWITAAYPLIRAAAAVSPARWEEFARAHIRSGGILALYAGEMTLLGLAVWRRDDCLRHGRTLLADVLITFELDRLAPARRAICEELERLASKTGCESLVVTLPSRGYAAPASEKMAMWGDLGFASATVTFVKPVSTEPGRHGEREALGPGP